MSLPEDTTLDLSPLADPPSFWRRRLAQDVLPLCMSMAIHAALIIAGIATYRVVRQIRAAVVEQVVVPEMAAIDVGGELPSFSGKGTDAPLTQPDNPLVTESDGSSKIRGRDLGAALSGGVAGSGEGATQLAIGYTPSVGGGGRGFIGTGPGEGPGGSGAKQALFGMGGGGPDVGVFRDTRSARKVVFVLDATGSMMGSFDALRPADARDASGHAPAAELQHHLRE